MTFRRIKQLFERVTSLLEAFKAKTTGDKPLDSLLVTEILAKYSDALFEMVRDLLNFFFEFKNEGFAPLDAEWVSDHVTIPGLFAVLEDVAAVNGVPWLVPFFRGFSAQALGKALGMSGRT